MMSTALSQRGTVLAAKRRTPASAAYRAAVKSAKGKSRYKVADKEARTIDGVTFDSMLEVRRYCQLCIRERLGEIANLELQPSWKVQINGLPFCRYTADFAYFDQKLKSRVIEDVKSRGGTDRDAAFKLRRKAAELYHGITITLVYQ